MATADIIKLAPTLTVEERYKIVIPECHRMLNGEKTILSESEMRALTFFEKNTIWEQYAFRIGLFKWAHILWIRDINAEKFSACTCLLLLNHQLWEVIADVDEGVTPEKREKGLASLRKYVSLLEDKLADFYAYREAIQRLQEELYDVPIFNPETASTIQGFFQFTAEMVERHNVAIRELCGNKEFKRYFKEIVKDMDQYIVKESKPGETAIAELLDDVKGFSQSDVNARLGR